MPSPRTPRSPLAASVAVLALVASALTAVLLATASPGRATGFGDGDLAWSTPDPVLGAGLDASAARLEPLPAGGLVAVLLADGDEHGHAGQTVLLSRVRSAVGAWGAVQVVPLGTSDASPRTLDTFADSAGRVLATWAEETDTAGVWLIRSVSRDAGGSWGVPEDVYTTRTHGQLSLLNQIPHIRPILVPSGDTATVAWATVAGYFGVLVDVADDPFRARRWTAGTWGAPLRSDGYGTAAAEVLPVDAEIIGVQGRSARAVRSADGRISFVFTLEKRRPVHSTLHPLSEGFAGQPNLPDQWDGVAEAPWQHSTKTAWVVHLDPGDASWGGPQPLVTRGGPILICGSPDLPDNPPLQEFWDEWRSRAQADSLTWSCPAHETTVESATYAPDGALRIWVDHRSGPTANVNFNYYLTDPCDDPSPDDPFCFDKWNLGGDDWAVDWPDAGITIPPDAGAPGADAVRETAPEVPPAHTVATDSGRVAISVVDDEDAGTANDSIVFDRSSGEDVTWRPDPTATSSIQVSHAFARGDDVAAFYSYGSATTLPRCGLVVLRAGATAVDTPISSCVSDTAFTDDVVQLADGVLAWISGNSAGAPLRLLGAEAQDPTDPTGPTDPTTGPTGPNPLPSPATFTSTSAAKVKGKARVGTKLKARPGTWQPAPTSIRYQWLRGSKRIPGATRAKLKVTRKYVGKRLAVRITVSRAGVQPATVKVKAKGKVRR